MIKSTPCQPCRECLLQAFFSHFRNPQMEDAEYIPYDLLDLREYLNSPDIYNYPPDLPMHNCIYIRRLNLEKVLYSMCPVASA